MKTRGIRLVCIALLVAGAALFNVACPTGGGGGGSSNGELVVLFSADDDTGSKYEAEEKATYVDEEDIEHLSFNVKTIVMFPAVGAPVTLFDGSTRVDLLALKNLRHILSQALVPPGNYGDISGTVTLLQITLADPLLALESNPTNWITDVSLAGGNIIDVTGYLPVFEDTDSLLTFELDGWDLEKNLDSTYTVNYAPPHVIVRSDPLDSRMTGTLTGLNKFADRFAIQGSPGIIQIDYSGAIIVKPDQTIGDENDLIPFDPVRVRGIVDTEGNLYADYVFMLDVLP